MTEPQDFYSQALQLSQAQTPFVSVHLVDTLGSAPQEIGARMLVSERGRCWGTVGGGKIEQHCIQTAQELLQRDSERDCWFYEWNLQTEIGMTCGGVVRMVFERHRPLRWPIAVFGAGHVAQALIPVLCTLPCQVICLDTRSEWLERLPVHPRLRCIHSHDLAAEVATLPAQSFVLSMTMGHAHDVPILAALFARQQSEPDAFPFVGVIGSPAKAGVIRRDLRQRGIPDQQIDQLHCPIGLPFGGNDPAEIAISISAQLLQLRDQLPGGRGKWQQPGYRKARKSSDSE
ncbi:MAG: xanthine dehydrogenase accessory protein XdhC [Candidatus Sericytochromatia bacterium]|nr:xanthine dehydrogenase accessory protein XdhC [Candidatus Sericytochromatia bacterium]